MDINTGKIVGGSTMVTSGFITAAAASNAGTNIATVLNGLGLTAITDINSTCFVAIVGLSISFVGLLVLLIGFLELEF